MTTNGHRKNATVWIQRFNPDFDRRPYLQPYSITARQGMTLLDALHEIKTHQDGSVTFRRSCRHAICGSCGMNVNGRNVLVCESPLKDHLDGKGRVTIRPLPFLPIIKDLVVDRAKFWEHYRQIKPWLLPPDDLPEREFRVSPEEVKELCNAEKCIMCGLCYSACQVVALNKGYIGPHALLKAFLRTLDPRDSAPGERLDIVSDSTGVWRCHTIFNCIDACPKSLDPTYAIETLRNLAARRLAFEEERRERQARFGEPVEVGPPVRMEPTARVEPPVQTGQRIT
jgi:succinate dehydrogenase / fumarate reductase iron-sulfur subunit